ncbi:uncharacterized protein LOC111405676 [Olea europaea var. sylvestris]|uniref:uncharacterized protein LOC111405676 n=1 Tax=Olea europaea var. sylvestris TaxID=158386 RepID=UPI000C1D74BC|nr:uncharacterized protein LOC111405676 [Olea europaea var. sylvestris]
MTKYFNSICLAPLEYLSFFEKKTVENYHNKVSAACPSSQEEQIVKCGLSNIHTSNKVKAAYRKKVWETHPDRFPNYEKVQAESKFKLISEAYTFLLNSGNPLIFIDFYLFIYFIFKVSIGH